MGCPTLQTESVSDSAHNMGYEGVDVFPSEPKIKVRVGFSFDIAVEENFVVVTDFEGGPVYQSMKRALKM